MLYLGIIGDPAGTSKAMPNNHTNQVEKRSNWVPGQPFQTWSVPQAWCLPYTALQWHIYHELKYLKYQIFCNPPQVEPRNHWPKRVVTTWGRWGRWGRRAWRICRTVASTPEPWQPWWPRVVLALWPHPTTSVTKTWLKTLQLQNCIYNQWYQWKHGWNSWIKTATSIHCNLIIWWCSSLIGFWIIHFHRIFIGLSIGNHPLWSRKPSWPCASSASSFWSHKRPGKARGPFLPGGVVDRSIINMHP